MPDRQHLSDVQAGGPLTFFDPESALATLGRIREAGGHDLAPLFAIAPIPIPDPDRAAHNLERWLVATGNIRLHVEQLAAMPALGARLLLLMGASQPLADSLIQNPELASLVLEPSANAGAAPSEKLVAEGRRLLANANSHRHALDRLRYLRQRVLLSLVLHDLLGDWPQPEVWRGLSDLADALLSLTLEAVWEDYAAGKGLPDACPVAVVAFGKLGGRELNYSSDVDLVYVMPDDTDEVLEPVLTRFCEVFGRALSERMGRGSLYRVDLRLRPYGGTGPILNRMRALEAYYDLYAEAWEVQALLRTRVVAGPESIAGRWESMRERVCFRRPILESTVEELAENRTRIEEFGDADDLKRGRGGIRDVEFLAQILQLVHGSRVPAVRVQSTLPALHALAETSALDPGRLRLLEEAYIFLRQLEHRLQLAGDRQTHALPTSPRDLLALARSMGFSDAEVLEDRLASTRTGVHAVYRATLGLGMEDGDARGLALQSLGDQGPAAAAWFDALPEAGAFYGQLVENRDSLDRVRKLLTYAPVLGARLRRSVGLTELALSGEGEETSDLPVSWPVDLPLKLLADSFATAHTRVLLRWVLAQDVPLEAELTRLAESLVRHLCRRIYAGFEVVALGSFANYELGPESDLDLLFLVADGAAHAQAESQAQDLLTMSAHLARLGAPVELDLRLRPEGRKGMLVATYDAIRAYDLGAMESWERFALGHARAIEASEAAMALLQHSAYTAPLNPERLNELTRMKHRIETERVPPQHAWRNVKLGLGGLGDIEWLVHLAEMRYPVETAAGTRHTLALRLGALSSAGLLNALEVEELREGHAHLLRVRTWLWLLGFEKDTIPENPAKLGRLAGAMGYADGNEFLRDHQALVERVRALYLESLERLRS